MTQEQKWIFIVNPVAGNGYGLTAGEHIKLKAAEYGKDFKIVFTERKGHATSISEEAVRQGYTHIIAVGGDGTFNEVATALTGKNNITTGIVPAGTGNDFIQILGFHDRFDEDDWKSFFDSESAAIDTGYCNGKTFFNGMGLGFDAQVASENYSAPGVVKKGGKNKYIWHIVKTLFFFREKPVKVLTNGTETMTRCFINTVAIGRRFAGGFFLTPEAIANDGLLDVCSIKSLSLIQRLRILMMVPKGTHIRDKKVHYYKTDHLVLEFEGEVPYHLDGELFFSDRFEIRVIPSSLNIIYDRTGKHYLKIS